MTRSGEPDLAAPIDDTDHIRGVSGARQLVVYGDFECPYTKATMLVLNDLLARGSQVEVVYRYFPLTDIHPHAQAAAEAAEAAARQDRFWEMHDLLFRNQARLEPPDLLGYATRVGLDLDRFAGDLASASLRARIERDVDSGDRSGVDGTPGLFIDGRRYDGMRDAASLRDALR